MPANQDRYETAVARYFEAWNAGGEEALTKAVTAAWTRTARTPTRWPTSAGTTGSPP